jgi:hypothetical protein
MVPGGIPHGPHPGAIEKSIGARETKELAIMVDGFHNSWQAGRKTYIFLILSKISTIV